MNTQVKYSRDEYPVLEVFAFALKIFSLFSVLLGLAFEGFMLYIWGRVSAFYDLIRQVLMNFGQAISTPGVNMGQIPSLPVWPLLIILGLIVVVMVMTALASWSAGQWIDLKLTQVDEERGARALQERTLNIIARDIMIVANYFTSLAPPRNKSQ